MNTTNGSSTSSGPGAAAAGSGTVSQIPQKTPSPREVMGRVLFKVAEIDPDFKPAAGIPSYQDQRGNEWIAPFAAPGGNIKTRAVPDNVALHILGIYRGDDEMRIYAIPTHQGIAPARITVRGLERWPEEMEFEAFCDAMAAELLGLDPDEDDPGDDEDPTLDDAREALKVWNEDLRMLRAAHSNGDAQEKRMLEEAILKAREGQGLALGLYLDMAHEALDEGVEALEKEAARIERRLLGLKAQIETLREEEAAEAAVDAAAETIEKKDDEARAAGADPWSSSPATS